MRCFEYVPSPCRTTLTPQNPSVISSLHANLKETGWVECDGQVGYQLNMRNSPAAVNLLPGILESGVKILIFAGDEDLICNYKGLEGMMDRLTWGGQTGWVVRPALYFRGELTGRRTRQRATGI